MMAYPRAFWPNSRGAAAAEMALMLPLLIVLMFVTFEGGYFLWSEHKIVKAVRDGARYAGRLSFTNYGCDGTVDETAETSIRNLTRTGKIAAGGAPIVPGWPDNENGVTIAVECQDDWGGIYTANSNDAPIVTVKAQVPYHSTPITGIASVFGFNPSGLSLRAEAQSPVMGL